MSYPTVIRGIQGAQYGDHVTQQQDLGQRMELSDGRKFRYVHVGVADLVVADLIQGTPVVAADYIDVATDAIAAVGDTEIVFTSATTTAANYYAGGYVWTNDATAAAAQGAMYRVKEHAVFTSGAGDILTLETYDPIRVAIAALDQIGMVPDPYSAVIQCPATTITGRCVGVAVVDNTLARYGWVQSGGVCAVQGLNANWIVGGNVSYIGAAAGQCAIPDGTETDPIIGFALSVPAANTDAGAVFLTID